MQATTPAVLVLGIGNLLWADEGFGVRAVEHLHRHWAFADNVRLADGGTQGIYLVQDIREADILVVFDAVDYGLPPATMKLVEGEDVPSFMGAKKVSLHQTGFQEVLAMAEMMGEPPAEMLLVGVQPEEIEDFGGSLRDAVKAQMEPAIAAALDWLAARGVHARRREQPLRPEQGIGSLEMLIERYEDERPDADAAPRLGDSRVLTGEQWAGPGSAEEHEEQVREILGGPNMRVML
ncbi:hydrogenase expression/formation protein [Novosphingobium nitrogenifigens DSM 19370]|uniref:Hydrogenase expression/formation protein HupD n=1 Tax=Novosphingobium nitrogenifigens DSM 19370 TaxID=983920 RepID=F1Z426_9SPHN|nr:HyaD/HybD family hydrogenase maturation endopeptidase [Novosphingobium nitrogenifigens]EGD60638.1 hydrogenase expression/formation protein [Novosphingobium nitrogenifigens DSM 19370]